MAQTDERKPLSEILVKSPLQRADIEAHKRVLETLRGAKGKDGRDGKDGNDGAAGRDGRDGYDGFDGKDGQDGKDGADGERGPRGPKGEKGEQGEPGERGADGKDGRDGSDDKPEDVVAKIHKSPVRIKAAMIEGYEQNQNDIATLKKRTGQMATMGGPTQLKVKNAGVPVGGVETINFIGATIATPAGGDGREINLTITGGGGSGAIIKATDSGDHTNFTLAQAPTTTSYYVLMNNGMYTADDAAFPFSVSGSTLTFNSALPASLYGTIIKLVCV